MSVSSIHEKADPEYIHQELDGSDDPDAKFGGHEARKKLEKKLLLKLDLRMSILIFIYILNYVSFLSTRRACSISNLVLNR